MTTVGIPSTLLALPLWKNPDAGLSFFFYESLSGTIPSTVMAAPQDFIQRAPNTLEFAQPRLHRST